MQPPSQDDIVRFFGALMANANGPITFKDVDGRLLLVNQAFASIHGRTPEELAGRLLSEIYPPERTRFFQERDRELVESGRALQNEVQAVTIDDERRDLLTQRFPVRDDEGRIVAIGTMNHDITRLKHTEAELERQRDRLDQEIALRTRELQALNAQKDRFFSIVAHDLREPFNVLLGYAELLSDRAAGLEPEAVAAIARMVHDSGTRAFKLLENLLLWARLQMGRVDFQAAPVAVEEPIAGAVALLRERAEQKGIRLATELHGRPVALVDPGTADTVMRNLLTNAVKFTDRGGSVVAAAGADGRRVRHTDSDTGCGIAPEALARLFELDRNASSPGTDGEVGTGLGLKLCRELLERQDGALTIDSRVGGGTVVAVSLPVA